ncbi:MAG: protein phosphatase 2C domain-containing protein [Novosphingobium sp.]
MTGALRIEDFALTDTGLARAENEDSHASLPQAQAWLVADGMGGHENGRFASQAIVDAVTAADLPQGIEAACQALGSAIHAANKRIFAAAADAGRLMGSTMVALVLRDDEFAVLWAGDSRAYLLRDDQLFQLTRDHSQVQDMIDRGLLTPEDAADHPMRHVLARAVGVQAALEVDAIRDHTHRGDLFLLCSDGLHGVVSDAEIAEILRGHGIGAAQPLVAACLARGAPDNVTVVLVSANEPTLLALAGEESAQ